MAATITEAAGRVAVVKGVMLRPTVSKNGRRYHKANIGRAHARLTERLADPTGRPVTMRTLHPASGSDQAVTNVVGRVTAVSLAEDGTLRWEADLADTTAGRDVAALTDGGYLRTVSIRGRWVGTVYADADGNETADDLEIDGLDFVVSPGVDDARIESAVLGEAARDFPLTESAEDCFVEIAPQGGAPMSETQVRYADPGYKADDRKRFPMESKAQVIVGLGHLSEDAAAEGYTPAQVRRIKGKLRNALREHGVDLSSKQSLAETAQELVDEAYACINLDNGNADIRVSGWINDPTDLPAVGQKMALAALAALANLDPDNDGDIDLDEPAESADQSTNSAAVVETETKEAPTMSETATAATATTEENKTEADKSAEETAAAQAKVAEEAIATAVAKGVAEALTALKPATEDKPAGDKPAEESTTTETKAPAEAIAESLRQGFIEGVKAAKDELRDEVTALFRAGGRKGLVVRTEESGEPTKPLHEMNDEEFRAYASERWASVMPVVR